MAKRLSVEQVTGILAQGTFDELIGTVEDDHLECKAAPYQIAQDHQKHELAKDVSAIANRSARAGSDGGYLLIGVGTSRSPDHLGDEVNRISSFPQALVDPAMYYQILSTWLMPTLEGVGIRWHASAQDQTRGIVAIWIPRQRLDHWPIIVVRTIADEPGRTVGTLVGYYERRGDHVVPLTPAELQRLLRDGQRFDTISQQIDAVAEQLRDLQKRQGPPALAPPPGPSPALQAYRQRRGETVAAGGLNGVSVYALTAAPVQVTVLPEIYRGPAHPLVRLLANPPQLRTRGFGVTVGDTEIVEGRLRRAAVPGRLVLECWPDGTLIFAAEADFICWGMSGPPQRINPLALAESTYLFADLVRRVYVHAEPPPEQVQFGLTLYRFETNGDTGRLAPGPLKSAAGQFGIGTRQAPVADIELRVVVPVGWTVGQAAYSLLARAYTWFGFDEEDIPYVSEANGVRTIDPDRILADGG